MICKADHFEEVNGKYFNALVMHVGIRGGFLRCDKVELLTLVFSIGFELAVKYFDGSRRVKLVLWSSFSSLRVDESNALCTLFWELRVDCSWKEGLNLEEWVGRNINLQRMEFPGREIVERLLESYHHRTTMWNLLELAFFGHDVWWWWISNGVQFLLLLYIFW